MKINMAHHFIEFFIILNLLSSVLSIVFPYVYPRFKTDTRSHRDAGDPLILTPYLKSNDIHKAQNLSRVPLTEKLGVASYAGFFTVAEDFDSNMYFWYFPPFSKRQDAPVVLWLQGGPGGSSLFGLFAELGPLVAKEDWFHIRKYHWALDYHLIFIDNPVGTGFSFTKHDQGYCNDEDCVARNLREALIQFFKMFPDLADNDFYITGESYAGKYIPSLAIEIHRNKGDRINLKGMAIGNGYCDPINQMGYGNYLYQHGLIDDNQLAMFEQLQENIIAEIEKENWPVADLLMDKLMDGEISKYSLFKNFTGFTDYYNFLQPTDTEDTAIFSKWLQNDVVRHNIHVGRQPFNNGDEVRVHLANEVLKSIAPYFTELLDHYRVLFYNGQLDIIVAYPLTENFLRKLEFRSSYEYKLAPRLQWKVGKTLAGYVKRAGNLTEILVRNAGHLVPKDQPKWAYNMITRFIEDKF